MNKRSIFLPLLLAFCLICQTAVFAAQLPSNEQKNDLSIRFLAAIGVLPQYEDAEYDAEATVSRGELAGALVRASGNAAGGAGNIHFSDVPSDHPQASYIYAAAQMGIMSGYSDGMFRPDYPVRYEEAIKTVVCLLGYTPRADLSGGYAAGYVSEAQRLDLLRGVGGKIGNFIALADFAKLMVNAIDVPLLDVKTMEGEAVSLGTDAQNTLLKERLGISWHVGIITESDRSALTGPSTLAVGTVRVGNVGEDDVVYRAAESDAADWLGYRAKVYYNEENEVLFVWPERQEKLTVAADDILEDDASFSESNFVYINENNKTESAKISITADVIYNGVSLTDFHKTDLKPSNGTVELLDNNNDGEYDVVFVNEYWDMVVGNIYADRYVFTDKNDSSRSIELDPRNKDYRCMLTMNGKYFSFGEVLGGNVLSVFESKNTTGRKVRRVIVSETKVSGTISEFGDETAVLEGVEYQTTEYFSREFSSIRPGIKGSFLLNFAGELTAFTGNDTSGEVYGYLFAKEADENKLTENMSFKILTEANTMEIFKGSAKMEIDGQYYKSFGEQKAAFSGIDRQLIRYRLNDDGEVAMLDTAVYRSADDSLSLDFDAKERYYYASTRVWGYEKNDFTVDTANTKFFVIPASEANKENEEMYFSSGVGTLGLAEGSLYMVSAYDINDNLEAGVVVLERDMTGTTDKTEGRAFMVERCTKIADADGNVVVKLSGRTEGAYAVKYITDMNVKHDYRSGDLIRIGTAPNGEIKATELILRPTLENTGTVVSEGSNTGDVRASFRLVYGALLRMDASAMLVSGADPESSDISALNPVNITNFTVTIYNARKQTVTAGTQAELAKYIYSANPEARVAFCMRSGNGRDIFVMDFS